MGARLERLLDDERPVHRAAIAALGGAKVFEGSERRHGSFDKACGSDEPRKWITQGKDINQMIAQWKDYCAKFREERKKWLLY